MSAETKVDAVVSDLLKPALGALAGTALGYVVWIRQRARELQVGHDADLRKARMAAYVRLWKQLELLALYSPRPPGVTFGDLDALGDNLRRWYFARGGLLLTDSSRDTYFLLQQAIEGARVAGAAPQLWLRRFEPSAHVTKDQASHAVEALREGLGLPAVSRPPGGRRGGFALWRRAVDRVIRAHQFGVPDDSGACLRDFALLQFLASSLRTQLAADLNSRDPSLLES